MLRRRVSSNDDHGVSVLAETHFKHIVEMGTLQACSQVEFRTLSPWCPFLKQCAMRLIANEYKRTRPFIYYAFDLVTDEEVILDFESGPLASWLDRLACDRQEFKDLLIREIYKESEEYEQTRKYTIGIRARSPQWDERHWDWEERQLDEL
jgi:hypothetical protein